MDSSLHDRLERLHEELRNIETTDDGERDLLGRLMSDIRSALDAPPASRPVEYGDLGDRLRAGITRLETSYPKAAVVMGQVVDALANLGL